MATIPLGRPLPNASRDPPGQPARKPARTGYPAQCCPYSVLLPMGLAVPPPLPTNAVGSYPTLSPFPPEDGGLLSVALSLGLASKLVSPAGFCPASCFHGARTFLCPPPFGIWQTAAARPAGAPDLGACGWRVKQRRSSGERAAHQEARRNGVPTGIDRGVAPPRSRRMQRDRGGRYQASEERAAPCGAPPRSRRPQ